MLTRYKVTLLNRALVREASQPLQKQLLPFPTAQAADCISVSCQLLFSLHKNLSNELLKNPRPRRPELQILAPQTRRRFGGRQPLCGIGVISRMATMCRPAAASARTADSRPEPGPFTFTSTLFMPNWSRAALAAVNPACWAAYGVPLREPLKPIEPAEELQITRPSGSVMVICVL